MGTPAAEFPGSSDDRCQGRWETLSPSCKWASLGNHGAVGVFGPPRGGKEMQARTLLGALVSVLTLTAGLSAQSQDDLIAERAKKLAKPIFKEGNWIFDYDEARAEAKKQGKLLFTYFTRSYAY